MTTQEWNVLRLFLLREAARNECSRVRITNDCLKSIFPRERIHYSKLRDLAGYMTPFFRDFKQVTERKGNKMGVILSIEKGKTGAGMLHRVSSLPSLDEMRDHVGVG